MKSKRIMKVAAGVCAGGLFLVVPYIIAQSHAQDVGEFRRLSTEETRALLSNAIVFNANRIRGTGEAFYANGRYWRHIDRVDEGGSYDVTNAELCINIQGYLGPRHCRLIYVNASQDYFFANSEQPERRWQVKVTKRAPENMPP